MIRAGSVHKLVPASIASGTGCDQCSKRARGTLESCRDCRIAEVGRRYQRLPDAAVRAWFLTIENVRRSRAKAALADAERSWARRLRRAACVIP
jgi:hypothetical protein